MKKTAFITTLGLVAFGLLAYALHKRKDLKLFKDWLERDEFEDNIFCC